MTQYRPDTPELAVAIDMLRQIYWREYGRGWKEAVQRVRAVLEQEAAAADGEQVAPKED